MVRPSLPTLAGVLVVAMLGFAAFAVSQRGRTADRRPQTAGPRVQGSQQLQPLPEIAPAQARSAPQPVAPARPRAYPVLKVRPGRSVPLRSKPGGKVIATVDATTQFGSPETL